MPKSRYPSYPWSNSEDRFQKLDARIDELENLVITLKNQLCECDTKIKNLTEKLNGPR